ncbi:hypothetical protein RAA17_21825 [Komagataeibacter rhaeticus]|nr:hypothetical protein [Komagataeibacter rhaeticus]
MRSDSPSGHSWTLTTLLGEFLFILETRYGSRDTNFTPIGIDFCGSIPSVWYPGNRNHVAITLTESARDNIPQAIFQLAHETVHLLSPSGGQNANVLEEGMATDFQMEVNIKYSLGFNLNLKSYKDSLFLFNQAKSIDPDFVRKIRKYNADIYKWKKMKSLP